MAAPPARPAPRYAWPSRALLIVAAVCALFAALTVCGSNILSAPAEAWGWGGVAAYFLSWAVP
jgi:hypothetical protein